MSDASKKTMLVFGGSGMLGTRVCVEAVRQGWLVKAPPSRLCNVGSYYQVVQQVTWGDVAVVINCAGVIPSRERPAADVLAVNTLGPHHIAAACMLNPAIGGPIPLIHVSTDCVFSGVPFSGGYLNFWDPHTTEEFPDAADLYGRSKLAGEVLDASHVTNVRTSFVGPEHGLMRWLMDSGPGPVEGWTEARWSGSTVEAVATALVRMASMDPPPGGVVHLATKEPISKMRALLEMRDALGLLTEVVPVYVPEINRALVPSPGWVLPPLKEALALLPVKAVTP